MAKKLFYKPALIFSAMLISSFLRTLQAILSEIWNIINQPIHLSLLSHTLGITQFPLLYCYALIILFKKSPLDPKSLPIKLIQESEKWGYPFIQSVNPRARSWVFTAIATLLLKTTTTTKSMGPTLPPRMFF